MTRAVLIVADDLTGALDVAGPFASRGHDTWVAVDPAGCAEATFERADVLSINVTSRHLPAQRAAMLVRDTARRLCPHPPAIVIKKIDSTLRGNVVAESLALLAATGRRIAVAVPAFPAQGRTVVRGVVHVHGQALAHTAFARDALSPPPLEPLDVAFRQAAPAARVSLVPAQGPFDVDSADAGLSVFVVDTHSDADLDRTVASLGADLSRCVLIGSAGVAGAVARHCLSPRAPAQRPPERGEIAFVVGSRAEASALQTAVLARRKDVAVADLPNGAGGLDAILRAPASILVLRATSAEAPANAADVARALARAATSLIQQRPVQTLVATGGDTAIAILNALSCSHLRVLGDVMPGIPCAELEAAGRRIRLLTKAGGFGDEGAFVELVERLRRGGE